jgi:hypothetical protein
MTMTLRDALAESAADVDEVATTTAPDGSVSYVAGGQTVAVVGASGTSGEFRLSKPVAGAAIRTPDTSASPRGPEWVRFEPAALDDHAIDRAVAWLGFAVRHATQN